MSKRFRPWKIDEIQLLPPSVQDYVAPGHLSRLIVALVRESIDLSEIAGSYRSGVGQPPFDPQLMAAPPNEEPDGTAQRNFSDPESRILKTKDGYIQGFNAQAAVDCTAQIIVVHGLTQSMSDQDQLVPLIDAIEHNLGRKPKQASTDAGYCSESNFEALADRKVSAYIATGRAKHAADVKRNITGPLTQAMRDKLKRAGWRSRYRLRKQVVEPVFGQIKQARGFRQSNRSCPSSSAPRKSSGSSTACTASSIARS